MVRPAVDPSVTSSSWPALVRVMRVVAEAEAVKMGPEPNWSTCKVAAPPELF